MFDFCQTWAPDVLRKNNWLVPEMTEFSLFKRYLVNFEGARKGLLRLQWPEFLRALEMMKDVRHTTVHRIVVGVQGVKNMIADAVALLEAVQDAKRHAKMSMIRAMVNSGDWDNTLLASSSYSVLTWGSGIQLLGWHRSYLCTWAPKAPRSLSKLITDLSLVETPLESVTVLPFYGRNIQSIDLTDDDDEVAMEDITAVPAGDPASNKFENVAENQEKQLVTEGSQFQPEQNEMSVGVSQTCALAIHGIGHVAEVPRVKQAIETARDGFKHGDIGVFKNASLAGFKLEFSGKENARPVTAVPEPFAGNSGLEPKSETGGLQAPLALGDGSRDSISLKSSPPTRFGVPTQIPAAPAILGVLSQQSQLQIRSRAFLASTASTPVVTMNARDPDAYAVIDDPIDMNFFSPRALQ